MTQCSIDGESCGFNCTGFDGSDTWKKLHKTVEEIPCQSCADHATKLMRGLHDHVNVGLGKQAFDPDNLAEFVHEVNCAYNKCKKEGRC